jgi:hypothetical protein
MFFEVDQCVEEDTCELTPHSASDDIAGMQVCPGTFDCRLCSPDGDVNGNGSLSPGDALCAFQAFLNGGALTPECDEPGWNCEETACDYNCDGSITPGDALEIFTDYLAGLPPTECGGAGVGEGALASSSPDVRPYRLLLGGAGESDADVISVPIVMEGVSGAAAFGVELIYDASALSFWRIETSDAARDWAAFDANEVVPGRLLAGGFDPAGLNEDVISFIRQEDGAVELGRLVFRRETPGVSGDFRAVMWREQILRRDKDKTPVPSAEVFYLGQPVPTPTNSGVYALVSIPDGDGGEVEVEVFDVNGRLVRRLLNEVLGGGVHRVEWDGRAASGRRVTTGVYFLKMSVKNKDIIKSRKIIVMK